MAQPLIDQSEFLPKGFPSSRRGNNFPTENSKQQVRQVRESAKIVASKVQVKEENKELLYGSISLFLKSGLLIIGLISLFKISFAAQQRLSRHLEAKSLLSNESLKLQKAQNRFDEIFSIGGKSLVVGEQDQWIAPNTVRIIWR